MSLGPVIRNVLAGQHTMILKDDLALRLERAEERDNGLGALIQRDGKLAFVPNYAGDQPVPKLQPYKEPAYVPFQGEHAYLDPNPGERVKITNIPTLSPETKNEFKPGDHVRLECTVKDLTDVGVPRKCAEEIAAGAVGEIVYVGRSSASARFSDACGQWNFSPKFLRRAEATAPSKQEHGFGIGQRVKKVNGYNKGQTGVVAKLHKNPDDGGDERQCVFVTYDDKKIGGYWTYPDYLEVLDAMPATPSWDPMTEPLRVGDIVEVAYEFSHTGRQGLVTAIDRDGTVHVENGRLGRWGNRSSLKLIERPNT